MKKLLLLLSILALAAGSAFAQLDSIANFNRAIIPQDSTMPYHNDIGKAANIGIRSVWVAENDLDQDGKPEVLITDYSNNGRVHVMELNNGVLEIVWSSPILPGLSGSGSTPRWVRTGDLDGDGNQEIIFSVSDGSLDKLLYVYEWDGTDNGFIEAITLAPDAFSSQGVTNVVRTNREVAAVYDFDGDGLDELMVPNRTGQAYVLGISGDIPGFGGWQLEGGDPATIPYNIGAGSYWHSIPADINGDGDIEIINHMWNFFGFWSINPTGADTYTYPDSAQQNKYIEFLSNQNIDAVAYMGIQAADVDGDGSDEIAGIQYTGSNEFDYDLYLIDFSSSDDELYSWDSSHVGRITNNAFSIGGDTVGQFWGIGALDIDGDGDDEILLGGISNYGATQEDNGYDVIAVDYNGSGSLLDKANYTPSIIYHSNYAYKQNRLEFRDSAGVVDTFAVTNLAPEDNTARPFVSKMYSGSDINGNGMPELIISYQAVYDSIAFQYSHWDGSAFVQDSIVKFLNPDQVTIRVLEATLTGIKEISLGIVTPEDYKLEQNYPNPFNPTTNIQFALPVDKKISLKVYDILGNEIKTLIANEEFAKGSYEATWDGTNNFGQSVASGQYIYTLKYGNFSKSMKMTLLK